MPHAGLSHYFYDPTLVEKRQKSKKLYRSWALLAHAQVHQFDFCAAGGASGEANNEAVLNLAGVRPGHLLMAEWHNSVGRPCHYVAADLANGCLVLAIRCQFRLLPAAYCNVSNIDCSLTHLTLILRGAQ